MHLPDSEFKMLNGLQHVNQAAMAASEHNEAMSLCSRGLASAYTDMHGLVRWSITPEGRKAVEGHNKEAAHG